LDAVHQQFEIPTSEAILHSTDAYTHPRGTRVGASDRSLGPMVSVVIPTLNEAKNLPHVFANLPPDIFEVIVVDGRSTDATIEVARALRPDVRIVRQTRRGKGDALRHGYAACRGDIIVTLDADGSMDATEITSFVDALTMGADFAKGSRFLPGGGSTDITRLRKWGNWALMRLVNVLYGSRYSDITYGYNAFWARLLPQLDLNCDGFAYEILVNCRIAKDELRVTEVPSRETPRLHGTSNLNAWRDGWAVLKIILHERFIGVSASPAVTAPVLLDGLLYGDDIDGATA